MINIIRNKANFMGYEIKISEKLTRQILVGKL
jgi:hypothetical protein